jgi:hypothetical protein
MRGILENISANKTGVWTQELPNDDCGYYVTTVCMHVNDVTIWKSSKSDEPDYYGFKTAMTSG